MQVRQWFDQRVMQYPRSVASTWLTSVGQLTPAGRTLLEVCALLAHAPVPISLFKESSGAQRFSQAVRELVTEDEMSGIALAGETIDFDDALADLLMFSLAKRTREDRFELHRLVQEMQAQRIPSNRLPKCAQAAIDLVSHALPTDVDKPETWLMFDQLLPHAERLVNNYKDHPNVTVYTTIASGVRDFLFSKGIYDAALPYAQLLERHYARSTGTEAPETLEQAHMLGLVFERLEKYSDAEHLYRREFKGLFRRYGHQHPLTLRSLNRLACLYGLKNDYKRSRRLFERAIRGRREVLGDRDPETLKSIQDLGWLCQRAGRHEEAEALFSEVLPKLRSALGHSAVDTLTVEHNLSIALEYRGDLAGARQILENALKLAVEARGFNHPHSLLLADRLANVLRACGENDPAATLYLNIIEARTRLYGNVDQDLMERMKYLARSMVAQGKLVEAEPVVRRALKAARASGRSENAEFALDLNNYALLLRKIQHFTEASLALREAIELENRFLPAEHPKRAHRRNNLSIVLMLNGQLAEAWQINGEAWSLKIGQHDMTSGRILFSRVILCWRLELEPRLFLGQLRTLLKIPDLPCLGGIDRVWDAGDILHQLRAQLEPLRIDLLTALVAVLNDHTRLPELDMFDQWRNQPMVALDEPW